MCGPKSLLAVCNNLNVSATLEEICSFTDYDEQSGTSLLGLYQAAIKKGLPVVPVKININQLCKIKSLAIAYVNRNHYLVVHSYTWRKLKIQNPPNAPYYISKKEFQKIWNGEALVFSEELKKKMAPVIALKVAAPKGPHIHFNKVVHFAGTIHEGTKLSHTFIFT